jgi:hypothetical protein
MTEDQCNALLSGSRALFREQRHEIDALRAQVAALFSAVREMALVAEIDPGAVAAIARRVMGEVE